MGDDDTNANTDRFFLVAGYGISEHHKANIGKTFETLPNIWSVIHMHRDESIDTKYCSDAEVDNGYAAHRYRKTSTPKNN